MIAFTKAMWNLESENFKSTMWVNESDFANLLQILDILVH